MTSDDKKAPEGTGSGSQNELQLATSDTVGLEVEGAKVAPRDTLPSAGGTALEDIVGSEEAAALKAEAKARREASAARREAAAAAASEAFDDEDDDKETSAMAFEPTAVADINQLRAAEGAEPLDFSPSTFVSEPALDELLSRANQSQDDDPLIADGSVDLAQPPISLDAARAHAAERLNTMMTPSAGPTVMGPTLSADAADDVFEEDSESTIYTPQSNAELSAAPSTKGPDPHAFEEDSGGFEATSFDNPDIKSIRDQVMKQIQAERQADRAKKMEAAVAKAPQGERHLSTIVDSQLSDEDLQQIDQAARQMQRHHAPITVPTGTGEGAVARVCSCGSATTQKALSVLGEQSQSKGHWLFVFASFLVILGGTAGVIKWGLARMGQFQGVGGVVLLGLGLGVLAGVCLSIRARDGAQSKLLFLSFAFALLSAGYIGAMGLVPGLNLFRVEAHGLALVQPWGPPLLRESVLWFVCLQAGLIGGWSFRLSSQGGALPANAPEYSEILAEFQDPDLERAGRSYNDILMRSHDVLKLLSAHEQHGAKCFYCFRNATALNRESQDREWEQWFLSCPHCAETLCVQHFAENAWQCRSCGKAIRAQMRRCADCEPGSLTAGQRALLCPHCHQWKGCKDHYKARGYKCPVCSHDVRAYVETYGNL